MSRRSNHPAQLDWLTLAEAPLLPFTASKSPAQTPEAAPLLMPRRGPDFREIVAQETAKRLYEIALAGDHSACFMGCPAALEDVRPLHEAAVALAAELKIPEPVAAIGGGRKARLSAPLFLEILPTRDEDRANPHPGEDSATVGERIVRARLARVALDAAWVKALGDGSEFVEPNAKRLMAQAIEAMELDRDAQGRVVQVTLTIAALAGASTLHRVHVAEALSYCRSPRQEQPLEPDPQPEPDPEPEPEPLPDPVQALAEQEPAVDWPEGAVRASDPIHAGDDRPYWKTSAYRFSGEILAWKDGCRPIELVIRGVRTVVSFGMGFATHAIDPPGSPYWSDTGFRSFTCCTTTDPEEVRAIIEAYIDAPAKDGNGCGGVLSPWWTMAVRQLRQHRGFISQHHEYAERSAEQGMKWEAQVRDEGFDPDVVAPWPAKARQKALL